MTTTTRWYVEVFNPAPGDTSPATVEAPDKQSAITAYAVQEGYSGDVSRLDVSEDWE